MVAKLIAFIAGGVTAASGLVITRFLDTRIPRFQQSASDVRPDSRKLDRDIPKHQPFFATGNTLFSFAPRSGFNLICGALLSVNPGATTAQASFMWRSFSSRRTFIHETQLRLRILPYYHTFTPHEDEYIAYIDQDTNKPTWQLTFNSSRQAQAPQYTSLTRWLHEEVLLTESSLKETIVVFGPGASYFARTAKSCTWHDLPQRLEKIILEQKQLYSNTDSSTNDAEKPAWIPRIVALGAYGTWVGIWEDGRCAWSLRATSKLTSQFHDDMSPADAADFENIVLSPHSLDDFFYATKQGCMNWSINADRHEDVGLVKMAAAADYYMQLRAKTDMRIFKLSQQVLGNAVKFTISPDTDYTEETLAGVLTPSRWQRLQDLMKWI